MYIIPKFTEPWVMFEDKVRIIGLLIVNHYEWKSKTKTILILNNIFPLKHNLFFIKITSILRYVTHQFFRRFRGQIGYSDSILANLNNTMHTRNPHAYSKISNVYTRDYFYGGRIFSRKWSNFSVFINSLSWNSIQYIIIF